MTASEAPTAQKTIPCHTCGRQVKLVRSVRIRQWIGPCPGLDHEKFDPTLFRDEAEYAEARVRGIEGLDFDIMALATDRSAPLDVRASQLDRYMQYRRGFICLECYHRLDNYYGLAVIKSGGPFKAFSLAGDSRGDKAAVYDYEKWRRYQAKLARGMGIDPRD